MTRVVVGGELRCQAVPRIRQPRPHRHEDAGSARGPAQRKGRQRNRAEYRERDPQPRSSRVDGLALRRCTCEQRRAGGDRDDRDDVARMDRLAQPPDRDREHEHETRPEQRLHEGERRARERKGLQRPAGQAERRACKPAPARDEASKQGDTQCLRCGSGAGLDRLQHDSDGVERRGAEGGDRSRQDARHDSCPP